MMRQWVRRARGEMFRFIIVDTEKYYRSEAVSSGPTDGL